jgi:hypothetical protein
MQVIGHGQPKWFVCMARAKNQEMTTLRVILAQLLLEKGK